MKAEPFDRCDNCGDPANAGSDRAWYISRFKTTTHDDHRQEIRGVLCEECSHKLGHGKAETGDLKDPRDEGEE